MKRTNGVSFEDWKAIFHADRDREPVEAYGFQIRREPQAANALSLILSADKKAKARSGSAYVVSRETALRIAADLVEAVREDMAERERS